jgi:drug/metabolite transporter (DMT)-like permease
MQGRRINWAIWTGFLLTLFAFVSYPFIFVRYPVTRDFPWANLLLLAIALFLVVIGVRRAYSPGRTPFAKIAASLVAVLSVAVLTFFLFLVFVLTKHLPASHGAPQIGQKVPDFTLSNQNGNSVSLATLLSYPLNGNRPKGALIIFYRGYW